MGNEGVPLRVQPAGFKTTTGQRPLPHLPQQRVIDVLMGDRGQEDQSIRFIEIQGPLVLMMVLEDLQNDLIERHDTFHTSLRGGGYEPMGIETINPEGLANQQFSILPVDAIPAECPKFSVPESST